MGKEQVLIELETLRELVKNIKPADVNAKWYQSAIQALKKTDEKKASGNDFMDKFIHMVSTIPADWDGLTENEKTWVASMIDKNKHHKLTKDEIAELSRCRHEVCSDEHYWRILSSIYKEDKEILEKIQFHKNYLASLKEIPYSYPCRMKTERTYMDSVKEFNKLIGMPEDEDMEEGLKQKDCMLEKIAAKLGIDVDINGDGFTSMQKYNP